MSRLSSPGRATSAVGPRSQRSSAAGLRYLRVVVLFGGRRVDIALPGSAVVADVIPSLLDLAGVPSTKSDARDWQLITIGGELLNREAVFVATGLVDGDILSLVPVVADVSSFVEDVHDGVEEAVRRTGRPFTGSTAITLLLTVATVLGLLIALLPTWREALGPVALSVGVGWAVLLLAAGVLVARRGPRLLSGALILAGAAWVAYLVFLLLRSTTGGVVSTVCGIVSATAVVSAMRLRWRATALPLALLTALTVACGLGAVMLAAGLDVPAAARLLGVLAILAVGVLPRLSIGLGGLVALDDRVRRAGAEPVEELDRRFEQSSALLIGALLGTAAVATAASITLAVTAADVWDRWLAVALLVALLLRARIVSRVAHVLALVVPGLIGGVALTVLLLVADWNRQVLVSGVALAVLVGGTLLAVMPTSGASRARVTRAVDVLELFFVLVVLGLACAGFGLFDAVRQVTS